MKKALFVAIFLVLSACSSEKPSDVSTQTAAKETTLPSSAGQPAAGAPQVQISPEAPTRDSVLTVSARGVNLADAKVEWMVNDMRVPGFSGFTCKCIDLKKGDAVQAKIIVNGKEMLSGIVRIQNSLPRIITAGIVPDAARPGDRLSAYATASDTDGDNVEISYEWTKNGEPAGKASTMDASIKRGDKISCKITPYDGIAYGNPVVLNREVGNLPPVISDENKFTVEGTKFRSVVKAYDPDGDTLTYSLKNAPAGMTIASDTGIVNWLVPREFSGRASFTVSVNDGHGGESTKIYNIDINNEVSH